MNEPKNPSANRVTTKSGFLLSSIFFYKCPALPLRRRLSFAGNATTNRESVTRPTGDGGYRFSSGAHYTLFAYTLAMAAVGAAVLASLQLGPVIKYPPTLFVCSVIFSSWFGGVWPGIFAGILSAVALDYFFMPPIYALGIDLEETPDMIAFVGSALLVGWLGEKGLGTKASLRQEREKVDINAGEGIGNLERVHDQSQLWAGTSEDGMTPAQNELPSGRQVAIGEYAVKNSGPEACVPPPGELTIDVGDQPEVVSLDLPAASPFSPDSYSDNEPLFSRQGDYWTIRYQGQVAHFKATRGLGNLASLLGNPGREFHVIELAASVLEDQSRVASGTITNGFAAGRDSLRAARFRDVGPVLDSRAKAEYSQRLRELRKELQEAEQLDDYERKIRAQNEMDSIVEELSTAVGLGGRNRMAASQVERARSAVTKRIKGSISKIAAAMPALGQHLATRVKTGYFCSYNPHPDRPVKWKLEF